MTIKEMYEKANEQLKHMILNDLLDKHGYLKLSRGNAKYKATRDIKYLIWNLPAVTSCPYACKECLNNCYARKAERYPTTVSSRARNIYIAKNYDFKNLMIKTIDYYLSLPSYKKAKKIVFRIHEAGDFFSKEYTAAWLEIIAHYKDNAKLVFGAYTKSSPYFLALGYKHGQYENLTVNGSVWNDTKPERLKEYKAMNLPIYTAMPKQELEKHPEFFKCECAGCGNSCNACFCHNPEYLKKAVVIH